MRWLTRKYLQERFEEYNLKVSRLYPEVHGRLKKQTFPAPLLFYKIIHFSVQFSAIVNRFIVT